MALSVNDGALEFDAVLNTDGIDSGAQAIENRLADIANPLNAALKQVDNSLADLLTNLKKIGATPELESLVTQFANLQKQELTLKDSLSKSVDPVQIKLYNDQLVDTQNKMKLVGDQVKNIPPLPDDSQNAEKTVNAYTRLRQIKNELAQIAIDGGQGSEEFEKLQTEATTLQNAITNTNKELKLSGSNVAGIEAVRESVRGLVGAFEAVSGAITIFGGDSKEAEAATKAVIGAMGILNGIEEVTALLSKNSAVNYYLEGLARKNTASATLEQVAATDALVEGQAAEVATTEAATVAQEGLNAAMLANPVAAILASLVGLFGAYELYTHTLGKATDAEKEKKASTEALNEANEKSIDAIAKEESSLQSLLVTAKSEVATKQDREDAINELSAKYPEYLGRLTTENVLTAQGTDLIGKQIEVIKKKALLAATEDLYTEALKKQLTIQNEISRIAAGGDLTLSEALRNTAAAITSAGTPDAGLDPRTRLLELLGKDLDEVKIKTDAVFQGLTDQSNQLTDLYQAPVDKINNLTKTLDFFLDKNKDFSQKIADIVNNKTPASNDPVAQSKKQYDQDYELAKAQAQRKIELVRQGDEAGLESAKLNLAKIEQEYVTNSNFILNNTNKTLSEIDDANAKHQETVNSINDEARARAYKANSDAAQANLIQLQALGQQETSGYFDAKIKAIKAAAAEEINQERFNADAVRKIRAQLELDLEQNEVDRKKVSLDGDKEILQSQLNSAKEGSAAELQLRIALIQNSVQEEENVIGLTSAKRAEIETKAAKDVADAVKKYNFDAAKNQLDTDEANIQTRLDSVKKGSFQELELNIELNDKKAAEDALAADETIKDEKLKSAKIYQIYSDSIAARKKLEDDFLQAQLQKQFAEIDRASSLTIQNLNQTVSNPFSSDVEKFDAQKAIIDQEIKDTQQKLDLASKSTRQNAADADALNIQIQELSNKLKALQDQSKVLQQQQDIVHLQQVAKDLNTIGSAFTTLSQDIGNLDDNLSKVFSTLGSITTAANTAASSLAEIKKGGLQGGFSGITDIVSGAAGVFGAFFTVVNTISGLINSAAEKRAALKEADANLQVQFETGEVAVNEEYRKRLVLQSQINKLKLDGIKAEEDALKINSQSTLDDYNKVLKDIQSQGKVSIPIGFSATDIAAAKLLENFGVSNGFTKAFDAATSLADKSFDDLQKLFLEGRLDDRATKLFQTLEQLKQEGVDIDAQLADNEEKAKELFTGTTADDIVNSIADGFSQGFKSVQDFAGKTQDIIRGAILNAIKTQALEAPIAKLFDQFAKDAESGGGLDLTEVANFTKSINQTISDAEKFAEQVQKATGINLADASNSNTLAGGITQITEQTANLLAGQFGGLRITAIDTLHAIQGQLSVLNEIADNTSVIALMDAKIKYLIDNGIKIR